VTEHDIQNEIRLALSEIAVTFRANVGKFKLADGRMISTGLPEGFSDLFGHRKSDGRVFYIEVKKPGGKVSDKQKKFIKQMQDQGALAGFAYSVEDALKIIR